MIIVPLIRTIFMYLAVVLFMRFLGKRQIGELEPSEFAVTVLISEFAAISLSDNSIPIANSIIPIVVLSCCEVLFSLLYMKSSGLRRLLCGQARIVVRDGTIIQPELKKLRYNLDELFEALRLGGVSDIRKVKYAILEKNGRLSILPYEKDSPLTPDGSGIKPKEKGMQHIVVSDGYLDKSALDNSGHNEQWLGRLLELQNIPSIKEVFLLSVDDMSNTVIQRKDGGAI